MRTSGIAFVLLLIAGFGVGPRCDEVTSTTFEACLLDSTSRFGAQYFLHGLGALAFLVFANELSAYVPARQNTSKSPRALMLVSSALWSGLWLMGLALSSAASDPGDFLVNAEGARSTFILINALLLAEASGVSYLPLALFLGATALAIRKATALPTWLGTTAAGLALLFVLASGLQLVFEAWLVLPMMPLFMTWVFVASLVMIRRAV